MNEIQKSFNSSFWKKLEFLVDFGGLGWVHGFMSSTYTLAYSTDCYAEKGRIFFFLGSLPIIWFKTQLNGYFLFQDVVIINGLTFTYFATFNPLVFYCLCFPLLEYGGDFWLWLENGLDGALQLNFLLIFHMGSLLNNKPNVYYIPNGKIGHIHQGGSTHCRFVKP